MKLSEAIRKGSKGTKQAFRTFFGDGSSCCALGAAYIACGKRPTSILRGYDAFRVRVQECIETDLETPTVHPVNNRVFELMLVVADLNDFERWSRKRIADWLESIGH